MMPKELCELIPHWGPMCLISTLMDWDEERIRCRSESHRSRDNPLRHQGRLHSVHAIEYGAQAAAIHAGLNGRERGSLPRPAVLAGASGVDLRVTRLDDLQGALEIWARCMVALGDNAIYEFSVGHAGQTLAKGRLILVRPGAEGG
jgi:predicted hotdog family 3-hydroxylacyl-ACP dehydratase